MRAIKRKMAFRTNDGKMFETKREAERHIEDIVVTLAHTRRRLKEKAAEQKRLKRMLAVAWVEVWVDRQSGSTYRNEMLAASYQRRIQRGKDEVRATEAQITMLRDRLRGGKKNG